MIIWKLKSGAESKVRGGYPWAFDKEIETPIGQHKPGDWVELQDSKGEFLARGYGNPKSQISFRALSFDSTEKKILTPERIIEKLLHAWEYRKNFGFKNSFRLCFGEGDFLPGLVIDYYLVEQNNKKAQVFAAQILTAGMDLALKNAEKIFENLVAIALEKKLSEISWSQTAVVLRNDVNVRKYEGLEIEPPRFIRSINGFEFQKIDILLNNVKMQCDLYEGQKTGFFLDQNYNIALIENLVHQMPSPTQGNNQIKILDLCSYVGHWSARLTQALKAKGFSVEAHLVDVSKSALTFAQFNAERAGASVVVHKLDVLKELDQLPDRAFDIVIADPPAFIKAKKDIPQGKHAYLKLMTSAFRMTKPGGIMASCSCSGHLTEEDLKEANRKAMLRNNLHAKLVLSGGHSFDHPTLLQFPEGNYLKMLVFRV